MSSFGGGFCQMAMCSIPELLPNKFRHVGVVLSDGFVFVIVVIGPIVGRYAVESGDDWKFIYWGGFVAQFVSLASLFVWYHPPQHPKGVTWKEGLRGVDYIGTALVVPGITLVLVGIIKSVLCITGILELLLTSAARPTNHPPMSQSLLPWLSALSSSLLSLSGRLSPTHDTSYVHHTSFDRTKAESLQLHSSWLSL